MGTSNRAVHRAKLNYEHPKSMPSKRYEYYAGGRGSNKETAMLARMRDTITERNDALDALEYSIQSLDTTGNISGTTPSLSTTGTWHAFGSSSSPEPTISRLSGEPIPYAGNVEDLYKQKVLDRQPQDLMSCIYIFSKTFQQLTERRINLDNSDLRTTEPFEYRLRMNEIDELFMFVARLMDSMVVTTRPEQLRGRLAERGLMEW